MGSLSRPVNCVWDISRPQSLIQLHEEKFLISSHSGKALVVPSLLNSRKKFMQIFYNGFHFCPFQFQRVMYSTALEPKLTRGVTCSCLRAIFLLALWILILVNSGLSLSLPCILHSVKFCMFLISQATPQLLNT